MEGSSDFAIEELGDFINISATNGATVNVVINVIKRDMHHDSLRWWSDMIDGIRGNTVSSRITKGPV